MGKSVFGLHRRERSAFLAEIGKVRRSRSKAGHRLSKASHFAHKGMGRSVFGLRRLERRADRVSSEIR